jgi:hypothetical protein
LEVELRFYVNWRSFETGSKVLWGILGIVNGKEAKKTCQD